MKTFKNYITEKSQRHPLEDHPYHKKTDAELHYIAKDAGEAARAMKGHNEKAEGKYLDQVNDASTVLHFRKQGMPDWYKEKYGHVGKVNEVSDELLSRYKEKAKKSADELESQGKYGKALRRRAGVLSATSKMVGRMGKKIESLAKEETEDLIEDVPPIHVRSLYAKTYARLGGTASKTKEAKEKAYSAIEQKYGKEMANRLRAFHENYEEDLQQIDEASPAWQRKEGKNPEGGLNRKGIASYRRENPGSKLSMAVTTKPSKLKKDSKAAKRRKSFCARMTGMKKRLTSAKTAKDPDSRINKSLRKWNC